MKLAYYAITILAVAASSSVFSMEQQDLSAQPAAQQRPAWVHPGPTTAENNPTTPIQGVSATGQSQGAVIDEGGNLKMTAPAQNATAPAKNPPVQHGVSMPNAGHIPMQTGPQGQMPQNQMPQNQMPQGQMPQGQMPQGQTQQGQMPQGQTPQGQAAQGQTPQGQMPQNQGTQPAQQPVTQGQTTTTPTQ